MIGTEQDPLRVAIVGSGPAGFYTAEHILKHEGTHAEVDMFDRLPTPYGLVRFGVAPDHPKIKSVIRVYEKTAARPEFRFFGNVEVGTDLSVDELRERYHAVVFAYGTATDRHLGIPGEELAGSHPATEFVNWYNAHPDFADREFDLSCERVVVIGNGNVAADVARLDPEGKPKKISLRFMRSPVEIQGDGRVERIVVAKNELQRDDSGRIRAVDTGERETIECGLVLRSIGYKGVPIEGVPFDERSAVIPNEAGRVLDPQSGQPLAGEFVVGWIKRGPTGVIGTNKKDAQETVDNIFADLEGGNIPEPELAGDRGSIETLLNERKPDHVTFEGWQAIDAAEVEAGKPHGRPRVKLCKVDELIEASKAKTAA